MFKVTERKNTNILADLLRLADPIVGTFAEVGDKALARNISAGTRSGVHYAGQPRTSSAPGEFSQEQTGELKGMVGHKRLALGVWVFGYFPVTREQLIKAVVNEYGAPRNGFVGRANGRRTATDTNVHREMVAEGGRRL